MVKIVTDSSIMLTVEEGKSEGIAIVPLCVSIKGASYREYEEISADQFMYHIDNGAIPSSTAPSLQDLKEAYASTDDEILHICMADGLSSAYDSASSFSAAPEYAQRVEVINSKTLCMPQRHMVFRARDLAKEGRTIPEIIDGIRDMMDTAASFLIPEDFDYLRRGGRLSVAAAGIMSILKTVPVLVQSDDGKKLEKLAISRKFDKARHAIAHALEARRVDASFRIDVSHANNRQKAERAIELLQEIFPGVTIGLHELGPAFITQGGPKCIAVQTVRVV